MCMTVSINIDYTILESRLPSTRWLSHERCVSGVECVRVYVCVCMCRERESARAREREKREIVCACVLWF